MKSINTRESWALALYPATNSLQLFSLATLLALSFSLAVASAQEFFPNDFARGAPADSKQQNEKSTPSQQTSNGLAKVSQFKDRIYAIAYVNSLNKEHFDKAVTRILAVQRQGKIRVVSVSHIGDYRNVDPKQQEALRNAGIIFGAVAELPKELPANISPVWGVMTPQSRKEKTAYVIQGYLEPELFFNQAGEFEVPAGMQVGEDTSKEGKLGEF
jgi:hypothetical protein